MTREDKIKAIKFLNDRGALLITKAGDKIYQTLRHLQIHPVQLHRQQ